MTDKPETNYAGESSYPYESLECKEDWSNDKKYLQDASKSYR